MTVADIVAFDGELEEKALAVLELVKSEHAPWDENAQAFCTPECLQRYLRARGGDVRRAATMLKDTLAFRRANDVDAVTLTPELRKDAAIGWLYVAGFDGEGRPVLMMRKRTTRLAPEEVEWFFKYLIFTMEATCRTLDRARRPGASPDGKWIWLLDQRNYSAANAPRWSVTSRALSIMNHHYPERLHRLYIVDAPSIFSLLYKAASVFVDERTAHKIEFVSAADRAAIEAAAKSGGDGDDAATDAAGAPAPEPAAAAPRTWGAAASAMIWGAPAAGGASGAPPPPLRADCTFAPLHGMFMRDFDGAAYGEVLEQAFA